MVLCSGEVFDRFDMRRTTVISEVQKYLRILSGGREPTLQHKHMDAPPPLYFITFLTRTGADSPTILLRLLL